MKNRSTIDENVCDYKPHYELPLEMIVYLFLLVSVQLAREK